MIRSSKHFFNNLNFHKQEVVNNFLSEYKKLTQGYIDYIWNHTFNDQKGLICFDVENDLLYLPLFLDYKVINLKTILSARIQSASLCQSIGIIRGQIEKRKKLLWVIEKRKTEGQSTTWYEKKLEKLTLTKPILKDNFKAELSSKNIDIQEADGFYQLFIRLKSTGLDLVNLPIKFHSQSEKWRNKKDSKLLNGILLSKDHLELRWEIPNPPQKKKGKVLGGDTGYKTILTLSDGKTTPLSDNHGHTLQSICQKLARKVKGSKNRKQTEKQRDDFIRWSVKRINLKGIKEIKLEKVVNIFYKKSTSKVMKGWTNALIEDSIQKLGEENGVRISLQPSAYKSQRCSGCGLVCKSNRKGKIYTCKNCGLIIDADLNGAINNEIDLPLLPFGLRQLKLNRQGFFWKSDGLFNLAGEELRVSHADKKL